MRKGTTSRKIKNFATAQNSRVGHKTGVNSFYYLISNYSPFSIYLNLSHGDHRLPLKRCHKTMVYGYFECVREHLIAISL